MNSSQRTVLLAGIILVSVTLLFPPWIANFDAPGYGGNVTEKLSSSSGPEHAERPAGYHFLFGQHLPTSDLGDLFGRGKLPLGYISMHIDASRLTVQVLAVLLPMWLLYWSFRTKDA